LPTLAVHPGDRQGQPAAAAGQPGLLAKAFLASVPSALFVLVPLFALLLRVLYLGSGRVYLEHLVVALYSHAFLCMGLLVVLLLSMLKGWATPHVGFVGTALGWVEGLLLAWMRCTCC
jgi:hypothetical protein